MTRRPRLLLVLFALYCIVRCADGAMLVKAGSADVSTNFVIRTAADGTATTGATITDIDLQYCRAGAAPAAKVDATALAAIDSAHGDNKAYEVDGTDQPGLYRVDWPDAAFAAGVPYVILSVKLASSFTEHMIVTLSAPVDSIAISGSSTAADNAEIVYDTDFATNYDTVSGYWSVNVAYWSDAGVAASATNSRPLVDVESISDDTTAADNLEAVLDGNGITADVDLTARSLTLTHDAGIGLAITGTDPAINIFGTAGDGVNITADAGIGLYVASSTNEALNIYSSAAEGILVTTIGTNKNAVTLVPDGTGHGLSGTLSDMRGTDSAALAATALSTAVWTAPHAAALADWIDGARLDLIVDAVLADTNELQTNQGAWATATGFSTHTAAGVITALKASTGWTAGGAATFADITKIDYAMLRGKFTLVGTTFTLYDDDDATSLGTWTTSATGRTPN